jgi:hypothetical protein
MAVRTIFSLAEDCLRGERLGWEEFVRDYSAFTHDLLTHYFPALAPEIADHVIEVFRRARAGDNSFFRDLKFANEREFAVAFRDLVFAYGRAAARLPEPQVSLDQVREVMKDLPVVEQQMLWLYMRGFHADRIAPMLMNAEATARKVEQIAAERVRSVVPSAYDDALVLSARALMQQAEQRRIDQCLPLKTFNNLVNGQLTWRERDAVEKHIGSCFYCLDHFTTFQEIIRMLKDRQPAPPAEVDRVTANLDLPKKTKKGLLSRVLGS